MVSNAPMDFFFNWNSVLACLVKLQFEQCLLETTVSGGNGCLCLFPMTYYFSLQGDASGDCSVYLADYCFSGNFDTGGKLGQQRGGERGVLQTGSSCGRKEMFFLAKSED